MRAKSLRFYAAFGGAGERPIIVGQSRFGSVATRWGRLMTAARYVALNRVRARSVDPRGKPALVEHRKRLPR